MGLHNRFPPHFYKRGNLFNTYLGYSDPPDATPAKPSKQTASSAKPKASAGKRQVPPPQTRRPAPHHAPPENPAAASYDNVVEFARAHMDVGDVERLLRLIAADVGVTVDDHASPKWSVLVKLGDLIESHVPPARARKFLAALESRLDRGEPLLNR